jgi:hypothetical protein
MGNGGSGVGTAGVFWVPGYGNCIVTKEGYPRIVSGPLRNKYLHRAVWERTAGRKLPRGWEVHHMASKLEWEPHLLLASPACLHARSEPLRDPYTGEFLSRQKWQKRYGSTI